MRNPITATEEINSVHFLSVREFLEFEYPESNPNRAEWKRWTAGGCRSGYSHDWWGPTNTGPKCALDHGILGDRELADIVCKKRSLLDDRTGARTVDHLQRIQVAKRRRTRGGFGDELDIHKVYQGNLDIAWSRTERVVVDSVHTLTTIFIDIGGNSNVDAESTLWRAAIITRLVEELEAAGKSVKVVVGAAVARLFTSYRGTPAMSTVSAVVKEFNQPLTIDRLAAMTHIGFYRSFGFACKQIFPYKCNACLGVSISVEKCIPLQLQEEVDAGHTRFIHIGRATSLEDAQQGLQSAYKQLEAYAGDSDEQVS